MPDPNIGSLSEDFVEAVAGQAFSPDFVFRSPQKSDGKEVTDILVLFDDVALVIQAKAQRPGPNGTGYADPSLSWAVKNLDKAYRQVNGAIRTIREGRLSHVQNTRRGRVPFNKADYPFLYGLILLDHESTPYDPFQLLPDLSHAPAPMHVLSHRDFFRIAKLLDTPLDLINYLESRTQVLLPTLKQIMMHDEAHPMRYYLARLEQIVRIRAETHGDFITEDDCRAYANDLRLIATESYPDRRYGVLMDHLIDRLHELEPQLDSPDDEMHKITATIYAKAATELGKLSRHKRILYGKKYLSVAMKAVETGKPSWVRVYNRRHSFCLILYASPLPRSERRRRAEELSAITALAKAYHQVHKAIGIATEAGADLGGSYDVVLKESLPVHDPKVDQLGREMFGEPSE